MGVFAVGTVPGLLGIGGLTSVIRGVLAQKFFKFAGVAVMSLSLFNINNALNLIGWNPINGLSLDGAVLAAATETNGVREGDVQTVRMTQDARGYSPNSFTIVQGVPVKWIVNSTDVNTCASSIVSSQIGTENLHPEKYYRVYSEARNNQFFLHDGHVSRIITVVDSVGGAQGAGGLARRSHAGGSCGEVDAGVAAKSRLLNSGSAPTSKRCALSKRYILKRKIFSPIRLS